MPNNYEKADAFLQLTPTDSATFPDGDPPVWEALRNPLWEGEATLYDRVARNVRTAIFFRFTAPYLYRPRPADVFFLASNTWSDYYSRPEGGGVSYTVLERLYQPAWVERNLASALPAATFTTERSDPALRTYRYLGCSDARGGSDSKRLGTPRVLLPDPTCAEPDPIQRALEEAKSQGDDLQGMGAPVGASVGVVRRFIEEHRPEFAPFRAGQLTVTNISVVFPGATTWAIPLLSAGVAWGTPNEEAWAIFSSLNDRTKWGGATDCSRSLPVAPGCTEVTPSGRFLDLSLGGSGFSSTVVHEASHFFGLLHPHDSRVVERDEEGNWERYGVQFVWLGDFSQAPTTYAGGFFPYGVLDQDIIQRGHVAEHLRMARDYLADAYLQDGVAGLAGPSPDTAKREAEMERWRGLAARLLACGDNLHAGYAARNATLAAQGVFGPLVAPRPLEPGERVLFTISPQPVFGPDGPVPGCATGDPATGRPGDASGPVVPTASGGGSAPRLQPSPTATATGVARAAGQDALLSTRLVATELFVQDVAPGRPRGDWAPTVLAGAALAGMSFGRRIRAPEARRPGPR